jgi:large subunit ribosomal protein L3
MTQVYDDGGSLRTVTVLRAGPCSVVQIKTGDGPDAYDAIQLGFEDVKPIQVKRPQIGHFRKAEITPKRVLHEVRVENPADYELGQVLDVNAFSEAQITRVDVTAKTKGHGFQGAMRRHGFGGQSATHGTERKHRSPGSIGGHSNNAGKAGNIKKGKKMAGQMGDVRRTVKNQRLIEIDSERNLILVEGAAPGPKNGLVFVRASQGQAS